MSVRGAATMMVVVAASLVMACQRPPASTVPPPLTAAAAVPGDSLLIDIPDDAVVRVMVAGDDSGWQEGSWVTTSAGCKGVLLTDALLLVRLAALTAMELRVPSADGHQWQPVPLTRIRDGEGCDNPAGF